MNDVILDKECYLSTFKNPKLGLVSVDKHNGLFPIRPSSRLAGIVADLTGDGHISRGLIQYISKNKSETLRFRKEFNALFGKLGKIRRGPTSKNTWECVIGSNALVKALVFSGVPFGNKTNREFEVPTWVCRGSRHMKARYVQRLFDCEGSVIFQKKKRIRIKLHMFKAVTYEANLREYLNQIRGILAEFGIRTTNLSYNGLNRRKDGSVSRGLEFEAQGTRRNLSSVTNFQRYINFETKRKAKVLGKSINYLMPP
jgi:intein/homing endonuclease